MLAAKPGPGRVVAPGNYDGVHCGHRELIQRAREVAGDRGWLTCPLFFDPHPFEVVAPNRPKPRLTTKDRRAALLRAAGADDVIVQRFDASFAARTPEQFVGGFLVDTLDARAVVVGPDFRFGKGRTGNLEMLQRLCAERAVQVAVVAPVEHDGDRVSSTRIRAALATGEVILAGKLLCRYHDVEGAVVEGQRRGTTLGFPTANLHCEPVMLPADGVYAVKARVLGDPNTLDGVANLGVRPTFDAGRSVEVHLLDFDGDLYGKRLRVAFVTRLRAEQAFASVEALTAQIGRDVEGARQALTKVSAGLLEAL